ncbi:MAG: flippase-like domain-containing protein [Dehalococcoidia bacterium]|nr:flippase-like domain-containing protein [Dehalococcoidia bacterium]
MLERLGVPKQEPPSLKRLLSLPTVISIAIAAILLVVLATRFDIDLGAAWAHIKAANMWLYLLAMAVNFSGLVVRAIRWRIVAGNAGRRQEGTQYIPSIGRAIVLILGGWFWNSVGWLRMGDGYRAYAFGRDAKVPFSRSLGIIAAERAMDVIAILPLLMLAIAGTLAVSMGQASKIFLIVALAMAAIAIGFLLALATLGRRAIRLVPHRFQQPYTQFSAATLGGFQRLPVVMSLSLCIWLLEACRLYLVVLALHVPVGRELALFVSLVNAILTTIPFTPGGTGFVEPGMVGVLVLSLQRDAAVAVALVDRSISYASVVLVGGVTFGVYETLIQRRTKSKIQGGTGENR